MHVISRPVEGTLSPITMLDRGNVISIKSRTFIAGLPKHVCSCRIEVVVIVVVVIEPI